MPFRSLIAAIIGLHLLLPAPNCLSGSKGQAKLEKLLNEQGFSGQLSGKVHIEKLGSLVCGAHPCRVLFYSWEESHPPGKAIHAAHRLIFLSAKRYIGSYAVRDYPQKLSDKSILFSYPDVNGNKISCSDIATRKHIVLDGETEEFFK